MKELKFFYKKFLPEIKKRIKEFRKNSKSNKKIFLELCFCLCTPQSKAKNCWFAVQILAKNNFFNFNKRKIAVVLKNSGVRFHNKKAKYIMAVGNGQRAMGRGQLIYKREWLVQTIKGLGLKESSHFLRNIGFGLKYAILDRHILKNLVKYRVIKKIPKNLNKKNYLLIEEKMQKFAKKVKIPMAELDLLFWAMETGEVFK